MNKANQQTVLSIEISATLALLWRWLGPTSYFLLLHLLLFHLSMCLFSQVSSTSTGSALEMTRTSLGFASSYSSSLTVSSLHVWPFWCSTNSPQPRPPYYFLLHILRLSLFRLSKCVCSTKRALFTREDGWDLPLTSFSILSISSCCFVSP